MQRRLHLAAVGRIAAARGRIVGAAQLDDLAGGILDDLRAGDEVGAAQPHLAPGREPEELLRRVLHEVVALDVEHARERHRPRARRRDPRGCCRSRTPRSAPPDSSRSRRGAAAARAITRGARLLRSSRTACSSSATSTRFSRLATPMRSQNVRIASGVIAAAPHPDDRRHARIVPARDVPFLDEREQLALAHHRVGEVEPGELDLPRLRRHRQVARSASRRAGGGPRTRACRASA